MRIRCLSISLVVLLAALLLQSCGGSEPDGGSNNVTVAKRTVLVYMVATNSLGTNKYDDDDLAEMDKAVASGATTGCRVIVYRTSYYTSSPELFEISNKNGKATHVSLKTYTETKGVSVTKARMSEVIADMKSIAPASTYGLVLWSHASGSVRTLYPSGLAPKTDVQLDYGEDRGVTMPVDQLAAAIPSGTFDFIYADVCYMASVEVAYQLRNCTRYFISSPTEIPATGMPYDENLPCFCADEAQLKQACVNTYNYYNAMSGQSRTMAISMVDCSKLDALASVCRRINARAKSVSTTGILYYNINSSHFYYDFLQYTSAICPDSSLLAELKTAYNDAVVYKASTPFIFGLIAIDEDNYSGLSMYVPTSTGNINDLYYRTLDWYKYLNE